MSADCSCLVSVGTPHPQHVHSRQRLQHGTCRSISAAVGLAAMVLVTVYLSAKGLLASHFSSLHLPVQTSLPPVAAQHGPAHSFTPDALRFPPLAYTYVHAPHQRPQAIPMVLLPPPHVQQPRTGMHGNPSVTSIAVAVAVALWVTLVWRQVTRWRETRLRLRGLRLHFAPLVFAPNPQLPTDPLSLRSADVCKPQAAGRELRPRVLPDEDHSGNEDGPPGPDVLPPLSYPGPIRVLTSLEAMEAATDHLLNERIVGVAAHPFSLSRPPALLQISTADCVYVYRVGALGSAEPLRPIFETDEVVKVGVGVCRWVGAYRGLVGDEGMGGFVELQDLGRLLGMGADAGLNALVWHLMGRRLGPGGAGRLGPGLAEGPAGVPELEPAELHYAATAAWVTRTLYLRALARCKEEGLDAGAVMMDDGCKCLAEKLKTNRSLTRLSMKSGMVPNRSLATSQGFSWAGSFQRI